jgi:hypothetical protein
MQNLTHLHQISLVQESSACPGEVGPGPPIQDMRQHKNLQHFPSQDAWSVIHHKCEAL